MTIFHFIFVMMLTFKQVIGRLKGSDDFSPYLLKVLEVKKVIGIKQISRLHPEMISASIQEPPDILQTQKL